jgi:sec-independent protein translocase protein TatC
MRQDKYVDPEDMFADTRMSFGDHIEELRLHLWRAIVGFGVCLILGFVLDGIGSVTGWPIGIGRPLLGLISEPVTQQLEKFYDRRLERVLEQMKTDPSLGGTNRPTEFVQLAFDRQQFLPLIQGKGPEEIDKPDPDAEVVRLWVRIEQPVNFVALLQQAERQVGKRPGLTTLSVTEAFIVYFKVSILAGIVISSPWVFWQIWSFVAAGLYPHEKRYVNVYLPFSLSLFLSGVLVCQFLVMPRAVEALLWFNEWIGLEPDLRLNEWLGFAILMPLVFGVSFQTPLVMYFLERIGIATVETYREKRRFAWFLLAIFTAVITPTPDALSMLFLWIPMCGLYELGIFLCKLSPRPADLDIDVPESEEMVEV